MVINLRLAREMFGDEDPVGKLVEDESEPDPASPIQDERTRLRIVGVIDDFRKDGEYSAPGELPDRPEPARRSERAGLSTPPPPRACQARHRRRLRGEAGLQAPRGRAGLDVPVRTAGAQAGSSRASIYIGPLAAAAVVAVFLLIMVAHGSDRRALAARHAAHAGDWPAAREGRDGRQRPAAARRARWPC